jgi:PAS domain S-box-containing protein
VLKLSDFLKAHRERIIERFVVDLARRDPKAGRLSRPLLLDHLPTFFDEVLFELDAAAGSLPDHRLPSARVHAQERWRSGFDVREVVREYGVLRHAIFSELREQGVELTAGEIEPLLNCLNAGIAESVVAFADESDAVRHTLDEKELALAANELRLTLVTESIPQIVWTAKADGHTDWLNGRWREYTGLDPALSLGLAWAEAYHPDDQTDAVERWKRATRTLERFEIEYRLRRHDGAYRWFLGRAIPVRDGSGNVTRWFGTYTDIDDQKQTHARLLEATQESARLNRLKDEFLATVSHELRTPLQSILGWARMLKAGHLPADRALAALETIERNAKAQSQLIEDILDVSRIITGKARIHAQVLQIADVLSAALDTIQPAARAKAIGLSSDASGDLGTLTGDPDRLQQVVWNLLSNAVKFTPPGGHIRLSALRDDGCVVIRVEDEGQGIDPAFLPYVFDRFRQEDAGPSRAHGGLGIGLAIVRHIVEMHGGSVSVESEGLGHGAAFTVVLPIASPQLTPVPPSITKPRSDPPLPEHDALAGVSVLVVDDQEDARDLMIAILLQHGARAHGAASAEEALTVLGQQPIGILVSDIAMPNQDGHALIRKVRASSELQDLPAIALTAYADEKDRRRALDAGYHLHLAKPVEPAHLVLAVAQIVRERLNAPAARD